MSAQGIETSGSGSSGGGDAGGGLITDYDKATIIACYRQIFGDLVDAAMPAKDKTEFIQAVKSEELKGAATHPEARPVQAYRLIDFGRLESMHYYMAEVPILDIKRGALDYIRVMDTFDRSPSKKELEKDLFSLGKAGGDNPEFTGRLAEQFKEDLTDQSQFAAWLQYEGNRVVEPAAKKQVEVEPGVVRVDEVAVEAAPKKSPEFSTFADRLFAELKQEEAEASQKAMNRLAFNGDEADRAQVAASLNTGVVSGAPVFKVKVNGAHRIIKLPPQSREAYN